MEGILSLQSFLCFFAQQKLCVGVGSWQLKTETPICVLASVTVFDRFWRFALDEATHRKDSDAIDEEEEDLGGGGGLEELHKDQSHI